MDYVPAEIVLEIVKHLQISSTVPRCYEYKSSREIKEQRKVSAIHAQNVTAAKKFTRSSHMLF
jgi:hypothetical protein